MAEINHTQELAGIRHSGFYEAKVSVHIIAISQGLTVSSVSTHGPAYPALSLSTNLASFNSETVAVGIRGTAGAIGTTGAVGILERVR